MPAIIRLAAAGDAAETAAIYRPAVTAAATSFELEPPDRAEMEKRIQATLRRTPWLVCVHNERLLGYAYAGRHRERAAYQWCVEVSAYVREDVRRAGVARALYTSLFAVLTLQGFRNAYAAVTLPNDTSVGFHTAMGFTTIGVFRRIGYKLGAWHDVQWLARELAPHTNAPEPPVLLPDIPEPALTAAIGSGTPLLRLSRDAAHSRD